MISVEQLAQTLLALVILGVILIVGSLVITILTIIWTGFAETIRKAKENEERDE